jgi:hypothetical protein
MSWVVTAIAAQVVSGALQAKQSRKAEKRAKADALEADKQARKAEAFAETEGEGIGSLGQISLDVDDDELDDETSPTVRI